MDSSSRRPKVARNTSADHQDRLSSFPDSILCHILSFLPSKHAAKTSVLSTRWKYVFLGVPNIDIDESLFEDDDNNEEFLYFVNRRLLLCKTSSIAKFRVKFRRMPKTSLINSWITFLLSRKIQVLEIKVDYGYSSNVRIPSEIFSSENLAVLKLSSGVLKVPEYVRLPNLKIFHLNYALVESESSCLVFAEGYPLLEDLMMDNIMLSMNEGLRISIPTLRKLTLKGLDIAGGLTRIDIDTPLVQYLLFNCGELDVNFNSKCEYLVESTLLLSLWPAQNTGILGAQWLSDLFRKIFNVKSLKLSMGVLEGLYHSTGSLPQFLKLTHLELRASNDYQRKSMWALLQNAPNLEMLVCDLDHATGTGYGVPEVDPLCLAQKLTKISVRNFEGSEVNFEVVRYLLQHGMILEKMIIGGCQCHYRRPMDWPPSIWKPLLLFQRGSTKCEIELT